MGFSHTDSAFLPGWAIKLGAYEAGMTSASRRISAPGVTPIVHSTLEPEPSSFRLSFEDESNFDIFLQDRLIIYRSADVAAPDTQSLLHEQVVPRLLAHFGSFILHASLVDVGGQAIALVGPSGRGKSTLGATFDRFGFALLGDDAVSLTLADGDVFAESLAPSLRLYSDSIEHIFGSDREGTLVRRSGKKSFRLRNRGQEAPRRLTAIFFLEPEDEANDVKLIDTKPAQVCMSLIENSFALDPQDLERGQAKLAMASALASRIDSYALSFPRNYAVLPDVRSAILRQIGVTALVPSSDAAQ